MVGSVEYDSLYCVRKLSCQTNINDCLIQYIVVVGVKAILSI